MRSLLFLVLLPGIACSPATASGKQPGVSPSRKPAHPAPVATPTARADGDDPKAFPLRVDMATPYFSGAATRAAAKAFSVEKWSEAREDFSAYLKKASAKLAAKTRARARLLMAVADAHTGAWTAAASGFEYALARLPLLRDYLQYQAARARYFAGDLDAALAHARKVAPGSIVGADAELLVGDIYRAKKQYAAMARTYEHYLAHRPHGIRLSEARFRLAQAYEAIGGKTRQALALYRKIAISDPVGAWTKQTQQRIIALVAALPAGARARTLTLTGAEHITRGMALFDAMRNPRSAAEFAAALADPSLSPAQRCVAAYHRAQSWYKQRDRTKAAPLFDAAIAACAKTDNADLQVKSAYQAGRAYTILDQYRIAIARFALVERNHPEHSYADDARLRAAEDYDQIGDEDEVTALLSTLPKRYPHGDMRAEAMWRLAWRAFKDKSYAEAIGWLKKEIQVMPIEPQYWARGRAQYWLGRAYAQLGDGARSVAAYESTVHTYPLSYYALLALNRLRESHPKAFATVVAAIAKPPKGYDPSQPAFHFEPRPMYGTATFQRGLAFLRLGLGAEAEAEFRKLGLEPPPGKHQVTDPDKAEKLWAMAFLYDRAGRYTDSHWVTRWHVIKYKRHWPVGRWRARWKIAYPHAYWRLLSKHAHEHGYPTELLISFVREESAFDPLMESYANAIGLTQMIFPTARRFAKGTGIHVSRAALRDPQKNVTIGSNFLAFLWNKFHGRVALVVPSYNAGEHATMRWLRKRSGWPADAWAEDIPYDQTRRYSKRVISSYFAYSYLKDGTIPKMPNTLPSQ